LATAPGSTAAWLSIASTASGVISAPVERTSAGAGLVSVHFSAGSAPAQRVVADEVRIMRPPGKV
jgi:hypothetical protein